MPGGAGNEFDFFVSRRGSVAAVAREVENVLSEKGYKVFVQDYDIPFGASFTEAMHEAIKSARDLVILFTQDYEASPYKMCIRDSGLAQDYLYSYMWLSLAASKLEGILGEVATRQRDTVARKMTSAQVLAAQEMAKRCEGSNYEQCDKPGGNLGISCLLYTSRCV